MAHDPRFNTDPSCLSGKTLDICEIEIEWDGGMLRLDPNACAMHSAHGDYPVGKPFKSRASMLSGKPSYLYRSDDLELALTFDELDRFCRKALRPTEFMKMAKAIGVKRYEIHDLSTV